VNIAFKVCAPQACIVIDDAARGNRCRLPAIVHGLACHNMFGGGASHASTTSTDQRTAASEGSLAVGAGGSFQEGGVRGHDNKIGSTEVGSGSTITITDTSADVLNKALDKFAELSSGYGSSLNQFVTQASDQQDQKLATLLAAVDSGKQSEDSAAQNRKLFLWIALGVLGLLAFLGWRKR
jgi:hypothetical protein